MLIQSAKLGVWVEHDWQLIKAYFLGNFGLRIRPYQLLVFSEKKANQPDRFTGVGGALGNGQAVSTQRAYSSALTARHARHTEEPYLLGSGMRTRLWKRPAAGDQAIV
jgi:hypothetical protein